MITERVREHLDRAGVTYEVVPHREAFTAQGVAAASHVSGWQMAKVLVGRDERGYVMAVLPATCRLDLPTFRRITRRRNLLLATEEELRQVFPDCEVGAMPPYGNLYDMPVYVDTCFSPEKELAFQAGNHHEIVRMAWEPFEKTVHPVRTDFCRR